MIDRLADDLRSELPEMKGFSRSNLKSMRAFAEAWASADDVERKLIAGLPWGHNVLLLQRLNGRDERLFYAARAVEHRWTRRVLQLRISTRLHDREGRALTNFAARLPEPDAEAAQLITRDPYTFEFLDLADEAREKDLERALVDDLEKFLRELGAGFAFVGSQVPFEVDGEDFYIDLLFFHIPTSRYVVIDLKLDKFKPKDAGQINFYVNVVDDRMRLENHAPTIGLVLCATRSETIVRYALDGLDNPLGVAAWETASRDKVLLDRVPEGLQLPAVEQLQEGLQRIVEAHAEEIARIGPSDPS